MHYPITKQIESNGKSCEEIIRKYGITNYEIGKTKVNIKINVFFNYNNSNSIINIRLHI